MAVTAQTLLTYLEKSGIKLAVVNGSLSVSTTSSRQPNAKEQAEIDANQSGLISILNARSASNVSGTPEVIVYGVTGAPSRFQRAQDQTIYNIVNTFNGNTGDVQGVSAWNGQTGDVTFNEYVSSWNGQTGAVTYVNINESTGILYGGQLSAVVGGTTFTVAAGVGQIVGYTFGSGGATATITAVTWGDYTGLTLANITASDFTRLYIDSSGDLQQQTAPFNHEDPLTKIIIGTISHIDRSTIALVTSKHLTAYDYPHKVYELYNTFGPIKEDGMVVSANGTNLSLNRSSGAALVLGANYGSSYDEPDTVDVSAETLADIARIYRDGSGDFIYDTNSLSFYSVVDPGYYDDGSGTLQVVNNNQYTIQRMFMFPNLQNVIMLYYGRVVYNSYSDALAGIQDEVFTEADITKDNAVFLGYLVVRGGAADLTDPVDGKFIQSGFCRSVPVGGGGGGGANIYAGAGLTLGGGSTMSIDSTQVIHVAGISSDGGITATENITISDTGSAVVGRINQNGSNMQFYPAGGLNFSVSGSGIFTWGSSTTTTHTIAGTYLKAGTYVHAGTGGISCDGGITAATEVRSQYFYGLNDDTGIDVDTTAQFHLKAAGSGIAIGNTSRLAVQKPLRTDDILHTTDGISMDTAGITFPDGTHQATATPAVKHVAGFMFDGRGASLAAGTTAGYKTNVLRPVEGDGTVTHFSMRSPTAVSALARAIVFKVPESYINSPGASLEADKTQIGYVTLSSGEYGTTGGLISTAGVSAGDLMFCQLIGTGWQDIAQVFVHYEV